MFGDVSGQISGQNIHTQTGCVGGGSCSSVFKSKTELHHMRVYALILSLMLPRQGGTSDVHYCPSVLKSRLRTQGSGVAIVAGMRVEKESPMCYSVG